MACRVRGMRRAIRPASVQLMTKFLFAATNSINAYMLIDLRMCSMSGYRRYLQVVHLGGYGAGNDLQYFVRLRTIEMLCFTKAEFSQWR